jgi:hypothetical protein
MPARAGGAAASTAAVAAAPRRFCGASGTEAPAGAKYCANCAAALPQPA